MSDSPQYARTEVRDGVAVVTMDRPSRLNAWGSEVSAQTVEQLRAAEANPDVGGVVLTGAGRAFSAGADLKEESTHSVDDADRYLEEHQGSPIFDVLGAYTKPVIAAVNGFAIGVGCLMCCCTDFILASTAASFRLPQTSLGILPAYGGTLRLARFVGRGNALHMALTGRAVGAEEARRIGLVVSVHEPDELLPVARETMREIIAYPPQALRLARESLRYGYDAGLAATEQADLFRQMMLYQTQGSAKQHEPWRGRAQGEAGPSSA